MTARILPSGIDTPELVVDRDRLYANVLGLQRTLDERGIRLRPHAKTHKSVRIGRLQVEAGARGPDRRHARGGGGVRPCRAARHLRRLSRLGRGTEGRTRARAPRGGGPAVGVDSAPAPSGWGGAVKGMSQRLRVLVEIDPASTGRGSATRRPPSLSRARRRLPGSTSKASSPMPAQLHAGARRRGLARRGQHARGRGRGARGGRLRDRDGQRRLDADAVAVGDGPRQRDPGRDLRPRRPPAASPSARWRPTRRRPSSSPRSCRRRRIASSWTRAPRR